MWANKYSSVTAENFYGEGIRLLKQLRTHWIVHYRKLKREKYGPNVMSPERRVKLLLYLYVRRGKGERY